MHRHKVETAIAYLWMDFLFSFRIDVNFHSDHVFTEEVDVACSQKDIIIYQDLSYWIPSAAADWKERYSMTAPMGNENSIELNINLKEA